MKANFPVYQFLGFKMIESHFYRNTDEKIKKFSVQVFDGDFQKDNSIYNIYARIKLEFGGCEESSFIFVAGYKVNDEQWMNELDESSIKSLFFSVVFPFIREKINCLCDDNRGGLVIPIIDLRGIDMTNEVVFTAN